MVFTLTGPDYYPSAAYVPIDTEGMASAIRLAGNGVAPDDGFSVYPSFGANGVGWWDRSVLDGDAGDGAGRLRNSPRL
jgi:hypothetical protein